MSKINKLMFSAVEAIRGKITENILKRKFFRNMCISINNNNRMHFYIVIENDQMKLLFSFRL